MLLRVVSIFIFFHFTNQPEVLRKDIMFSDLPMLQDLLTNRCKNLGNHRLESLKL